MNKERATEIIESLGVIEVKYKGEPVWLENIYKDTDIVKVKNLNTDKKYNVELTDLKED